MKIFVKVFSVLVSLVLVSSSFLGTVKVNSVQGTTIATLADSLNSYLNSIDWSKPSASTIQFGIIFSRLPTSAYEDALKYYLGINDWIDVLLIKRLAELSGYNSKNLVLAVVKALENIPMVGCLPKTDEMWNGQYYADYFSVDSRFLLHAYRWAKQVSGDINTDGTVDIFDAVVLSKAFGSLVNSSNWNSNCDLNGDGTVNKLDSAILADNFGQSSLMSKWNEPFAYQQLAGLVDEYDGGFSYAGVGTVIPFPDPQNLTSFQHNSRYYDEEAQTLGCFHIFEEDGLLTARNYEDKIWNHLNNDGWWSGQWYWYRPNWQVFECEMGRFAIEITEYLGYVHPNIVSDLNQKLLVNEWNSSSWQPWLYVVNHANNPDGSIVSEEARPEETLAIWEALESFYTSFSISMQNAVTDMLTKEPKAWEQVLNQSCYKKDQLAGAMIMFLNGIIPETGSLRDSLTEESYTSCDLNFPASEYRFDYVNRMIRIPTTSGQIGFQFGTQIVSYNFTQGVWDIYFNNDWNSIKNVVSVSSGNI
ncbi:MAG: dockerin type I domain-containing protein [Candidatus Bathyarchaeia archaeon]